MNWKHQVWILILLVFGLSSNAQDRTVGLFFNSEESFDGYTLFTSLQNRRIFLIDNCGRKVHEWEDDKTAANSVDLLPDGRLLRTAKSPFVSTAVNIGGGGEMVQLVEWDGTISWEFTYVDDSVRLHHDAAMLPNGNILMLAWESRDSQECIDAGRRPNLLRANELFPEHIIEVKPTGPTSGDIVWEWHMWDHLIQDFDPAKPNFGSIADHPERFDVNYVNLQEPYSDGKDWCHANTLSYNPELDQIIINYQRWCEFYIIDHSTTTAEAAGHTGGRYGKGGDILYRWGNPFASQLGEPETQRTWGQHDVKWIPNDVPGAGKILLFNNGHWRFPKYSEVLIIDPPQSAPGEYIREPGQAFGPAEPEVLFGSADQLDFFSYFISGVSRMPNGNFLICEGDEGKMFEINSSGEEVWSYINPQGTRNNADLLSQGDTASSNGRYDENATFRAERYALDYPAFEGKDLTPGDPIELNPWVYTCQLWPNETVVFSLFPNPAYSEVSLFMENSGPTFLPFEIYDLLGKCIFEGELGIDLVYVDVSSWESGMYIVHLHNGQYKRLVVQK